MLYTPFLLNGAWEMYYQEEKYIGTKSPLSDGYEDSVADAAGTEPEDRSSNVIENAIPGYWEDMTEAFEEAPFFRELRINPEYGLQRYPMAGSPPDMALPNVVGNFFYRRRFVLSKEAEQDKENFGGTADAVVLHFEGVQNAVSAWINDVYLGHHEGYSAPFDMKIPDGVLKDGENTIVLSVSNHRLEGYIGEPVSGLTSRAANEYTGGITGDVELRTYSSPLRDAVVLVAKDCNAATIKVEFSEAARYEPYVSNGCDRRKVSFTWVVRDGEKILKSGTEEVEHSDIYEVTFDTCELVRWSPENPKLYTLEITCGESTLSRTFGVRSLVAEGQHLKFNGVSYYLRGICEHCYFPETIHPNHDYAYYRSIIKNIKKLEFNFIRFHTYVPEEEYLQAADELGMLVQVECPNNATLSKWEEIVKFCRRHTCVVIYCCGNELLMDELFIEHLRKCGDFVHANTDALFSPMSAMRGLEYFWVEPEQEAETKEEPFKHHPRRIRTVGEFSDLYSSYPNGQHSYFSLDGDPEKVDEWGGVYQKPRISHEICIDGTYTDLSLKDRYKGTRVGRTEMFTSLEAHLEKKGVLKKAPLYFRNSSEWQRRVRKYCFENVRRSNNIAGYDFLGPIDTHWHTFGYDVGMMNEFYELKPGETVRNVRMYNSPTVLLNDLGRKTNFAAGDTLGCGILVSYFGKGDLRAVQLIIRLSLNGEVIERRTVEIEDIKNGQVNKIYDFTCELPKVQKPGAMKLYVTLDGAGVFAENEWELYVFPTTDESNACENLTGIDGAMENNMLISEGMPLEELETLLEDGKDVLIFGTEPFVSLPTTYRIALAGRTSGNLATVVADHPAYGELPHEGFCGWQFGELLEGGRAVCFESDAVPFDPMIEVVSTHKYVIRQAAMFEFCVGKGRLLVCSLSFKDHDPAAKWLRNSLISYMRGDAFCPKHAINVKQLRALADGKVKKTAANTNLAFNANDKTAVRGKKK
ncbi:MAG: beta galactosidase jelly roll domain-containing protein [Lachnospiraceae bacterium]|nr:beta galactosidase jelly roll domain-containing protein [Lachnospiraceae bacterium]